MSQQGKGVEAFSKLAFMGFEQPPVSMPEASNLRPSDWPVSEQPWPMQGPMHHQHQQHQQHQQQEQQQQQQQPCGIQDCDQAVQNQRLVAEKLLTLNQLKYADELPPHHGTSGAK
jgi:hypothetical protein